MAGASQIKTRAAARVRQNFKEKASQTIFKSNVDSNQILNELEMRQF